MCKYVGCWKGKAYANKLPQEKTTSSLDVDSITLLSSANHLLIVMINYSPGPEVIKQFSCTTELRMKMLLLIKNKMLKNNDISCFKALRCCMYPAHNVKIRPANKC